MLRVLIVNIPTLPGGRHTRRLSTPKRDQAGSSRGRNQGLVELFWFRDYEGFVDLDRIYRPSVVNLRRKPFGPTCFGLVTTASTFEAL